jgi:4-diphosphocytidyl-2-C-methyl-D-erythritol kinase
MSLTARWFLIVHPGCAISTAEIFQAPELTRNSPLITIRAFAAGQTTSNVCEPVARNRYPEVGAALDWLEAHIGRERYWAAGAHDRHGRMRIRQF